MLFSAHSFPSSEPCLSPASREIPRSSALAGPRPHRPEESRGENPRSAPARPVSALPYLRLIAKRKKLEMTLSCSTHRERDEPGAARQRQMYRQMQMTVNNFYVKGSNFVLQNPSIISIYR